MLGLHDIHISYLPLAHMLERVIQVSVLYHSTTALLLRSMAVLDSTDWDFLNGYWLLILCTNTCIFLSENPDWVVAVFFFVLGKKTAC